LSDKDSRPAASVMFTGNPPYSIPPYSSPCRLADSLPMPAQKFGVI